MNNKLYELIQNARSNPKKTAKRIYDLALEYSKENMDYDISIYNEVDEHKADNIIVSFLTLIDQNLLDSNISMRYLSKVAEHLSNLRNQLVISSDSLEDNGDCCEYNNFYVELAIKYLRELYLTSENIPDRVECHEKAILNIHKILIEKNILDKKQNLLISELKDGLDIAKKATSRKSKKIVEIASKLKEKDELDKKQSELIDKLDKNLIEKEEIDNMQNSLLNELKQEIENKNTLDQYQSELIESIQHTLMKKDEVDKKQSRLLLKLREELIEKEILDLEQTQSIYKLETIIANNQTQIDLLAKKIEFLDKFTIKNDLNYNSVSVKVYILFSLCLVLNILTILYIFLRK